MKRFMLIVLAAFTCSLSVVTISEAEPQYRGVMISPQVQAGDLQVLGQTWKVNFIRWQLNWTTMPANSTTLEQYDQWLDGALKHLDSLLPLCEKFGIKVLVDLHTLPGGRNSNKEHLIFKDAQCQTKFIQVWDMIARRYADNKTVWGYDLANEPIQGIVPNGLMDWHHLATTVAQKIRSVDDAHVIVFEPDNWAYPDSFVNLLPLPSSITNVVYSFHMYIPYKFTHQEVDPNLTKKLRYPGVVDKKMWDKTELRRSVQGVVDFQKRHNARILVGEFSAIRWAPAGSAFNYLKDVIDIFESNSWDWTYHAFREYNGWSVEHTEKRNDNAVSQKQTNREKLLRSWFGKNAR